MMEASPVDYGRALPHLVQLARYENSEMLACNQNRVMGPEEGINMINETNQLSRRKTDIVIIDMGILEEKQYCEDYRIENTIVNTPIIERVAENIYYMRY